VSSVHVCHSYGCFSYSDINSWRRGDGVCYNAGWMLKGEEGREKKRRKKDGRKERREKEGGYNKGNK
jgi:hypothetical protein